MTKRLQFAAVLVLVAAWVLPLRAEERRTAREGNSWVEVSSGNLAAAHSLKVSTDLGSVTVRGGSSAGISYTIKKRVYTSAENVARRQFGAFTIKAWQRGDVAVLEGNCTEGSGGRRMAVDITVSVPREMAAVKVATQGGEVTVSNVTGRVDAQTGGGGISLSDVSGPINAETKGGGIEVGNVGGDVRLGTAGGGITIRSAGGRVEARTAGGSIEMGTAARDAVLETAAGNIQVKQCGGELHASTGGGSVDVGDVNGPATLETSGGSIRLGSAKGLVKAKTSGGGIRLNRLSYGVMAWTAAGPIITEFVAQRGNFKDSVLDTSVGDVVVYLPPDLPVTVRATIDTALGHTIRSEFPEVKITTEGGAYGPREVYGQGAINGGGPLLKIRTTAGNIELKKGSR